MPENLFSLANTAKAVHTTLAEAFATIPEGRTHVVIVDGTYGGPSGYDSSVRMLYARRVGNGWNIVLDGSIDKPHGLAGRVATMKSW